MAKLYRVRYDVISQAERMREKYYYLSEKELWEVEESNNMTNEEIELHYKRSEYYYNKAEEIDKALLSIVGYNQATWENIVKLKNSAYVRDMLDNEI